MMSPLQHTSRRGINYVRVYDSVMDTENFLEPNIINLIFFYLQVLPVASKGNMAILYKKHKKQ